MGWIADIVEKTQEIPISGVLRERLAYAEQRHSDLQVERDKLAEELNKLTVRIESLESENTQLRKPVAGNQQQEFEVSDIDEQILIYISDRDEVESAEVAGVLQIAQAKADYYLTGLLENEYLIDSFGMGYQTYSLDQRGRAHLVENGLI